MVSKLCSLWAVFRRRVQSAGGQDCGCPVPPSQPSPQGEGERWHGGGKLERRGCSPRLFVVSESHDYQAGAYYQCTGECFSLSSSERVGVRGNEANSNPRRTMTRGTVKRRESPGRAAAFPI